MLADLTTLYHVGLGRATALRFADAGARVVCADLKDSSNIEKEIRSKHGDKSAVFIACNVTDETAIAELVKGVVAWGGRLDIMCNYAGVGVEARWGLSLRAHETPTEAFDEAMSINTRGVWLSCKYALQQMLAQEPREPNARGERTRGWILNAASMVLLLRFSYVLDLR